jgi:multiple sugar transport system substrate-binding protein
MVDGPYTPSYAIRGHLQDLGDWLGDDLANFTDAGLEAATFDGKVYSTPFANSSQVMFYNKDLFDAAGIEYPSIDPDERWTWEQALEAALAITDEDAGIWGLIPEQADKPYQMIVMPESKGQEMISEDGFQVSGYIDSPVAVEAMEFYQKLFTEWKVAPVGLDYTVHGELFGNGKVAMFVGGTWNFNQFRDRYEDQGLNYGVAPHPYFEGGEPYTPTGSWHIGVNPRTEYPEEAKTFIKWITSDDSMKMWFELRGYPPVKKTVFPMLPEVFETPEWKLIQYELDNTAKPRPRTPGWAEYEDLYIKALRDIQQGVDVQERLTQAATEIDKEMEKYK